MIQALDRIGAPAQDPRQVQTTAMIRYLRGAVLSAPKGCERFHAVFLDARQAYLADASMGVERITALTLRMRDLFSKALAVGARGLIVAHNHPSGDCRPSRSDILATHRLKEVAIALDIELIDHLILTENAVYSMRAGGDL